MTLEQKLEGVLFYKATAMKKTALLKLCGCKEEELSAASEALKERLTSGATRLIATDSELELVTAPELDELLEGIRKDDMKRDIGKAGAETLAIILYRGPLNRAEIDRIRGVNSAFILRNLLVRGLIERETEGKNVRYKISGELLKHLGVTDKQDLPEFVEIMNALDAYEQQTAVKTDAS